MDRNDTAQQVAESLWAYEKALSEALARGAEHVATLTQAHGELGLALKVAAPAIRRLTATLGPLAELRVEVGGAHDELAKVQRDHGLEVEAFLGGEKGPNDDVWPKGQLRQVA